MIVWPSWRVICEMKTQRLPRVSSLKEMNEAAIIKIQFNKRAIKTSTAERGVMQLMHLALGCEFTLNGDVQPMLSRALQAITLPRCHFIIWNSCKSDWMAPRPQSYIFPVVWGILGCVAELLLETACVKGMNWRVQIVSVMEDGLRLCLCYNSLFLRPLWILFTYFLHFQNRQQSSFSLFHFCLLFLRSLLWMAWCAPVTFTLVGRD